MLRATPWLEPAERKGFFLDFDTTDQDGQPFNLQSLAGKPSAVSFLYTSCPMPQMCPLIATTMARLQRHAVEAGIGDQVRLVLISYDPGRDTPERLKKYGEERGLHFGRGPATAPADVAHPATSPASAPADAGSALMLRPKLDEMRALLEELSVRAQYQADGTVSHFQELILIDKQGRYVRDYSGAIWDNAAVLEDLKRLAAEEAVAKG